jgi:hypothetical protein
LAPLFDESGQTGVDYGGGAAAVGHDRVGGHAHYCSGKSGCSCSLFSLPPAVVRHSRETHEAHAARLLEPELSLILEQ